MTNYLNPANNPPDPNFANAGYHNDQGNPLHYDPSRTQEEENRRLLDGVSPSAAAVVEPVAIDLKATALADAVAKGWRVFVSPFKRNAKVMVQSGRSTVCLLGQDIPFIAGMTAPGGTEVRRIGDVYAKFVGGVLLVDPNKVNPATQQPTGDIILKWAESHSEVCRDAINDPQAEIWASMKMGQRETATNRPSMPPSMDVDAVLRGDYSSVAGGKASLVTKAKAILERQGTAAAV